MLYFTADLHLCHDDMRKIRGFENTDEMNEYIISRWNDTVEEDDDIYVLGDIVCGPPINAECYLKRLKGKKHFLIGNHDFGWMRKTPNYKDYFVSVKNIEYMFLDDAFLSSAIIRFWNGPEAVISIRKNPILYTDISIQAEQQRHFR